MSKNSRKFKIENLILKQGDLKALKRETKIAPLYKNEQDAENKLTELREEIADSQELLFADGRYGVFVIFQGLDGSGKDSAIKHVLGGLNPQGILVSTFGPPSKEELQHDFMWRTHQKIPPRGKIGVFNRSYYEETIVVRVHPEMLDAERLPQVEEGKHKTRKIFEHRFQDISAFEDYLTRQGYKIVKFYLHLSSEEQRKRFLARLDDPEKYWKFDPSDIRDRERSDDMREAYAECLAVTSTKTNPWHIIPADDKANARLMIAGILNEAIKALPLKFPKLTSEQLKSMKAAQRALS